MATQTPKTFFFHMATQTPYTYFFFWTLAEIFPYVKVMLDLVSIFFIRAQSIFLTCPYRLLIEPCNLVSIFFIRDQSIFFNFSLYTLL